MRDLITVAKFTAREMIKRKSFLISNLIILLLIVIGFNVPNVMNTINGNNVEEQGNDNLILIVDEENIYKGTLESLNQMDTGMKFDISNEKQDREELKSRITEKEIESAVIITKEGDTVNAEYLVESLGLYDHPETLNQMLSELYKSVKLEDMGLSEQQIILASAPITLNLTELSGGASGGMLFAAMMLCIVLFYAIYFCAYQVSSSITTEKTSKIMETLVTSTTPKTIVLGKTIGIGIVGLLQVLAIMVVAVLSYKLFLPEGSLEGIFDISKITPAFAIITIVYFILGYTLYALLYALTGSTVSKPEDINSANSPISILVIVGFYLAYFSMMNPSSSINYFATIFPFSSPFSMPFRAIGDGMSLGELGVSLAVLVITIIVIANIAIKIYSSAILHYGTRLSFKDMINMYKDKKIK